MARCKDKRCCSWYLDYYHKRSKHEKRLLGARRMLGCGGLLIFSGRCCSPSEATFLESLSLLLRKESWDICKVSASGYRIHTQSCRDGPTTQTDGPAKNKLWRDRRPCCMTSRTCELAVMGTSSIKDKQPTLQSPSEPPVSGHFPNHKSSAVLTLIRLLNCKYFTSPPYKPPYPGRCAELAT
jgi:hypothetical protein